MLAFTVEFYLCRWMKRENLLMWQRKQVFLAMKQPDHLTKTFMSYAVPFCLPTNNILPSSINNPRFKTLHVSQFFRRMQPFQSLPFESKPNINTLNDEL